MAATTNKKTKFQRKSKKQYKMVTFESSIFEGEFTLPALEQMPNHVPRALSGADIEGKLPAWLDAAGVESEAIEVIGTLDSEEFGTFMEEWGKASEVTVPKSSK